MSEKEPPESYFDSELALILQEPGIADRNSLLAEFAYELVTDSNNAFERDPHKSSRRFRNGEDGYEYILPGIPHFGSISYDIPMLKVPNPLNPSDTELYITTEHHILRVPQGRMFKLPVGDNPLVYFSMTSCSCVVARSVDYLYVSHIGLSETGQVLGTMRFLEEEKQYLVLEGFVNTGEFPGNYGSSTSKFDYRPAPLDVYKHAGIPVDSIHTFAYTPVTRGGCVVGDNVMGLMITPKFSCGFNWDAVDRSYKKGKNTELKNIIVTEYV